MRRLDESGMTLLETLVSLGIFSVVIVFTMGLFISGIKAQARVSEMNLVNNEASFLLDRIGREIRMAKDVSDMQILKFDGSTILNPGPRIKFTNHDSNPTVYCQADFSGACKNPGDYVSVSYDNGANFTQISSPNVKMVDLKFYSNGDPAGVPPTQKIITIYLELQSLKDPSVSIGLQTSVVPRVY